MTGLETLHEADWFIVLAIGVSLAFGALRGFVRSAMSLATWITAFIVVRLFAPVLGGLLGAWISSAGAALAIAGFILFFATMITGAMLANLARDIVRIAGLSGPDRLLGAFFGAARGVIIVSVVLYFAAPVFEHDSWWQSSLLVQSLMSVQDALIEALRAVVQALAGIGR